MQGVLALRIVGLAGLGSATADIVLERTLTHGQKGQRGLIFLARAA
jgi:hypothetical protein